MLMFSHSTIYKISDTANKTDTTNKLIMYNILNKWYIYIYIYIYIQLIKLSIIHYNDSKLIEIDNKKEEYLWRNLTTYRTDTCLSLVMAGKCDHTY